MKEIIFCHFGPFWKNEKKPWRHYHFTHVYHNDNHMTYGSWDIECDRHNFWSFLVIFCTFTWITTWKSKVLKKKKKKPRDIIILHKCTKNHDHMLYCSWDMAWNGCNVYFSFWAIFCPFTSLTTQKMDGKMA